MNILQLRIADILAGCTELLLLLMNYFEHIPWLAIR